MEDIPQIRLDEKAKTKLIDFIFDPNCTQGERRDYVVLEGNCVLVSVTRKRTTDECILLKITEFYAFENIACKAYSQYSTNKKSYCHLLEWHFSTVEGLPSIEDSNHKALDIFMDYHDSINIHRKIPSLSANELRVVMKSAANGDYSLQHLTKRVIQSHCVEIDQLPLPKQIVCYLKE